MGKPVKELFDSRNGELCFIVGLGPSVKNAEKHLKEKHPHSFTIALNRSIEHFPADYWFWMDLEAYNASKDHPNAKAAKRVGVNVWEKDYDEDTYIWERAGNPDKMGVEGHRDFAQDIKDGKFAYSGVSAIGAASLAWRLGAFRIVFVGCENTMNEEYVKARELADPSKNWRSIYTFTFARISEALKHRSVWMHPKVMMVDASHTGTQWGELALEKTTIPKEFEALDAFYRHLWTSGGIPKKKQLILRN